MNNEIHILGGGDTTAHYKWDGTSWERVSTLPYNFRGGSAVVLDDEIHIIGGSSGNTIDPIMKSHYKWDGTSWERVSTLPRSMSYGTAVVYNNRIHIMGGRDGNYASRSHDQWDGTQWTNLGCASLPSDASTGSWSSVVLNGKMYILGSQSFYVGGTSSWTQIQSAPFKSDRPCMVSYNNSLYAFGSNTGDRQNMYKWDGTSWNKIPMNHSMCYGCAVVYDGEIHSLGGGDAPTKHDIAYLMPKFKYSLYLNKGCKIFSKDNLYPLENCHKEDNSIVVDENGEISVAVSTENDMTNLYMLDCDINNNNILDILR